MAIKWVTIKIHNDANQTVSDMAKDMRLPKSFLMDEIIRRGIRDMKKNGILRTYSPENVYK